MTPSSQPYVATLSRINNILPILDAFGLESEAAMLRPMLQKCRGEAARPGPGNDLPDSAGQFAKPSPPPGALTSLETVLSKIRSILPDPVADEIARHDSTKRRLSRIFEGANQWKTASRIRGCQAAHMVLRAFDLQDPAQVHLIPYVCNQRSCPACSRRRSWKAFNRVMAEVGPRILHQPDEYALRSIVFTIRSPAWGALEPALEDLLRAWRAMRRPSHALWSENVHGYLYNVEITCNIKARTWHPHLHVVYTGEYIYQRPLDVAWNRRLCRHDRDGHAHIAACYVVDPDGSHRVLAPNASSSSDVVGCLREVTKYTLKPFETSQVPDFAILELHHAVKSKGLTGAGGILAMSPASTKTRFRNLGGLGRMLDDRDSLYWTSDKFAGQLLHAAVRDHARHLRLVQNYSHFGYLQMSAASHSEEDPSPC